MLLKKLIFIGILFVTFCGSLALAGMLVQSFNGPVTNDEIQSFLSYAASLSPAVDNIGNNWAQGGDKSGEAVKAMGLVFEVTQNLKILDQMIKFCDAVYTARNDLAAANVVWTGRADPCWPNTDTPRTSGSGGEQGDPAGHLGYCSLLILQTPSIWDNVVPIADKYLLGSTYLLRAKKYLAGADYAMSNHILKSALDLSNGNRLYFSKSNPYKSGEEVPWNQLMMFLYAFQNLAAAHDILEDSPSLSEKYHNLVQVNLDWMANEGVVRVPKGPKGRPVCRWGYALPDVNGEDQNHGQLDVAGLYRAYQTGRYGLGASFMTAIANTFWDIVYKGPDDFAGRLDGTDGTGNSAPTNYVRAGYFPLIEFRPDMFDEMAAESRIKAGSSDHTAMDSVSRMFWAKNQRYQSFSASASPCPGEVYTNNYMLTIKPKSAWNRPVAVSVLGLPSGATFTLNGTESNEVKSGMSAILTVSTDYSTPAGSFPLKIVSRGWGAVSQVASVTMVVLQQLPKPKFSIDGDTYTGKQTLTITSQIPSSSIRYTTDGTTPTYNKGNIYKSPITITKTTTIKAVTCSPNYKDSSTTTEVYTIK